MALLCSRLQVLIVRLLLHHLSISFDGSAAFRKQIDRSSSASGAAPTATSRMNDSYPLQESVAALTTPVGQKKIIFIRHGKSAGNAGLKGAVEKGTIVAYRDGKLVNRGKKQVEDRMNLIYETMPQLYRSIAEADLVLVSPLIRAMTTAVIALAHVHNRTANPKFPRIEVVADLREKVKSSSERPGTGVHPMMAMEKYVKQYGWKYFNNEDAMTQVLVDLRTSYEHEELRTLKKGKSWQPEPDDALKYIDTVTRFKASLQKRPETNILLVGHSGWSRFAFSGFLPAAPVVAGFAKATLSGLRKESVLDRSLAYGARNIYSLNNAGVIVAAFEDGDFVLPTNFGIPLTTQTLPGDDEFPNCVAYRSLGVFVSKRDAIPLGLVPDSLPIFERFMVKMKVDESKDQQRKKPRRGSSRLPTQLQIGKKVMITVSMLANGGKAHLAWSSKWGKPLSRILISDKKATIRQIDTRQLEITEIVENRRGRTVFLWTSTDDDAMRLFNLVLQAGAHYVGCGGSRRDCNPWTDIVLGLEKGT